MEAAGSFSFENVFESINDPVSVHDTDLRIIRANEAMCSLLGQKQEKIIGRHCYKVFHGTDRPWHNCPHFKCVQTGEATVETIEDPNLPYPLLVSCSPINDKNGKIRGTVHLVRTLSKTRTAESGYSATSSVLEMLSRLEGYLLICASCRKIKDEEGQWDYLEHYIASHSSVLFSHGICPECYGKFKKELGRYAVERG